jgi:hypothetical protein
LPAAEPSFACNSCQTIYRINRIIVVTNDHHDRAIQRPVFALITASINMGVTKHFARFLAESHHQGVSYKKSLTLGRQHLFVEPEKLMLMLREINCWPPNLSPAEFTQRISSSEYVDPFLEMLGAESVDAVDISKYEGASIIHDLDQEVPPRLRESFDCVIDGGLLEHVFNFPLAIKSCMEMTRCGGHVVLFTTANNFFGHGFYQFSPELFFRIFSPENGFEVVRILAQENEFIMTGALGLPFRIDLAGPWYEVADPAKLGRRVELVNGCPTVLYVLAKRTKILPIFAKFPKQSDYLITWGDAKAIAQPVYRPPLWKRTLGKIMGTILTESSRTKLKLYVLRKFRSRIERRKCKQWYRAQSLQNESSFKRAA